MDISKVLPKEGRYSVISIRSNVLSKVEEVSDLEEARKLKKNVDMSIDESRYVIDSAGKFAIKPTLSESIDLKSVNKIN